MVRSGMRLNEATAIERSATETEKTSFFPMNLRFFGNRVERLLALIRAIEVSWCGNDDRRHTRAE